MWVLSLVSFLLTDVLVRGEQHAVHDAKFCGP